MSRLTAGDDHVDKAMKKFASVWDALFDLVLHAGPKVAIALKRAA